MSDKKRSRTACNGKEAADDVIDAVKTAIDKLPSIEEFHKVVARNLDEMNEDLFKFYWVKILPKAVGAKQFTEEKKFFGTPCSAHVGNRFIVSVATEAFALLAFENYHTRWPAKWAIKSKEAAGRQLKFARSEDALANVSSKYHGINVLDEANKAFM